MKINKSIGWLIGVFILFPIFVVIYNKVTVSRNDGKQHFESYFKKMVKYPVTVPKLDGAFSDTLNVAFDHYRIGADPVGFKGRSGEIISVSFLELSKNKYFRYSLYDVNYQEFHNITDLMEGKEIDIYLNQDDLTNPVYGTKDNPIPFFKFKGTNGVVGIDSLNEKNEIVKVSLETTDTDYQHNVLTYLTYIMPAAEFKKRFENKKD